MFCLPVIAETDYEAFAQVMRPILPRTYSGWLALSDEWRRQHRQDGVLAVPVKSNEYAGYMNSAGLEISLQTLLDFVAFNPWHDPD